jgi:signal peptidase I
MSTLRLRRGAILGWAATIALALCVALATRAYAVQTFSIPSASMTPTLPVGAHIVVDKLYSTIHRGDIIVFHRVPADTDTADPILVKRVIGLPGETISSVGNAVLINGKPIAEPWLPALRGQCTESAEDIHTTRIASGHYFVMGDCRGISDDSRYWGTVPASYVIGKVDAIIWESNHPWLHWF